jgi:hypothetical protein
MGSLIIPAWSAWQSVTRLFTDRGSSPAKLL